MNRKQRFKNRDTAERLAVRVRKESICFFCGNPGSHFVPPSFGESGFFYCRKEAHRHE